MTESKYSSTFTQITESDFIEKIATATSMAQALYLVTSSNSSSEGTTLGIIARVRHLGLPTDHWRKPITDDWLKSRFLRVYDRETRSERPTTYTVPYMAIYGLKKCEICKQDTHNGKAIPLEVDHIDGDAWNCVYENLRAICANCHRLQDTSIAGRGVLFAE